MIIIQIFTILVILTFIIGASLFLIIGDDKIVDDETKNDLYY